MVTETLFPGEAWGKLASRKQHNKLIDLPALDEEGKPICKVIIRTLTHDQHIDIQKASMFETDRTFKEEKPDRASIVYQERYGNISAKHFLFYACRNPEDIVKPFFPSADHVGKYLSNDEIATLMQHYLSLQDETGPIIAYMSPAEMEEKIKVLAEDAENSPYFLDRFLLEAKDQLLMYIVNQLWTCRMDKSLPTLQQENSSINITPIV